MMRRLQQLLRVVQVAAALLIGLVTVQLWGWSAPLATAKGGGATALVGPLASSQPVVPALPSLEPPGPPVTVRLDRFSLPSPPAVDVAAPLAVGKGAPKLRLQGVVLGERPRAYVVDDASGQTFSVRPGDQVGPVTIREIHERSLLIEREGETYELRL